MKVIKEENKMITQKEALKNILETMPNEMIRYQAVFNWLEDINWHTEARILAEKLNEYQIKELEAMEELDYILNSNNYCDQFIAEFKEQHPEAVKAVEKATNGIYFYRGYDFSRSQMFDFKTAQTFYKTFNQIFGWGMNSEDWGCTHGDLLVAELVRLIEEE